MTLRAFWLSIVGYFCVCGVAAYLLVPRAGEPPVSVPAFPQLPPASWIPPAVPLSQVINRYALAKSNFVLVTCLRKDLHDSGVGSGVLVRSGGRVFVWTCAHVLTSDKTGEFDSKSARIGIQVAGKDYEGKVLACGQLDVPDDDDVALIEVMNPPAESGSAIFDTTQESSGDSVFYVGAVRGVPIPPSFFIGRLAAPDFFIDKHYTDELDCAAYPGCSGSAVYLDSGKCVGLMEATLTGSISFTISARTMYRWAQRNKVEFAFPR